MSVRTHHVAASLFAGAILLATAALFTLQAPIALAACPSGATISLSNPSTTSTNTFAGNQTLHAHSSSTPMASGMTFMIAAPTSVVLGQGTLSGTEWNLDWDSRNVPNGTYQMVAIGHYGTNTAYDCPSAMVPFSVNNAPTQQPTLTANISPNSWQGIPGGSASFTVGAIYVDQFGRQSPMPTGSVIAWTTPAGTLSSPGQPTTIFTAGPVTGSFEINARVTANGLTANTAVFIKINPPTAGSGGTSGSGSTPEPSPGPSPSPSPMISPLPKSSGTDDNATPNIQLTPQEVQRLQTAPTIFRPTTPTNSNPVVPVKNLGCLEYVLGSIRYNEISSGKSQPSAEERKGSAKCFSGSDRIPSLLAPVEPAHVTELAAETALIKVDSLKNETIKNTAGNTMAAILVNGTSTPNTSVFIYIFSDPMVLRAQTDSQGKWSYVLQNPLKPGSHEVYAVAEKDSGNFVRTPAVPVSIAAAAPGSQDGSLIIERPWQAAQIGFLAAAIAMVLGAIFLLFRLRRRSHLVTPGGQAVPAIIHPETTPVATSATAAPVVPAASDPAPPAPDAPAQPSQPPTPAEPPADETKV